ncbi:MAG: sulfatase [Deltaproteobacteria bacterium]|nr:sulfatase [Deltaproteobacteria bacterium]
MPNVVLFSVDTLRADHLGLSGHEGGISPGIDAFGREAVVFTDAWSQAPTTAPSHMSIFTGLLPSVHGVANIDSGSLRPLDRAIATFPELLFEHGYLTAGFHGGGNVDAALGFGRGFYLYSQDLVSYNWMLAHEEPRDLDAIRRWIELTRDRGRPFFLFLHHYVCHAPYLSAPQAFRDRFLSEKVVPGLPSGIGDAARDEALRELERVPPGRSKLDLIARMFAGRERAFWGGVDLGRADHRAHVMGLYDAGVAYADELFSKVLRLLKDEGVSDDTVVALVSDHGEEFFEHGGKEHGRLFAEHLRVPLIIRFPKRAGIGARVVRQTVGEFDVMPTILDYLGIPVPGPTQARSLLPLARGEGGSVPPVVSYGGPESGAVRIEQDGFSYAEERYEGADVALFDTAKDAAEKVNLAAVRGDVVARMREAAARQREKDASVLGRLRGDGGGAPSVDGRLVERLKALGYLE